MVLKLHGALYSTCTQRVLLVCKELNLPYEFVNVNIQVGEQKDPAYMKNQPFGQVPFIDDDGFILFESRAIARYLVQKHGSPLIPVGDLKKLALFEQAASIEQADFDPYAYGYALEKIFKPAMGLQPNDAFAEQLKGTLEKKLQGYEAILGKQKYLAGEEVTLADLFHLPYGALITNALKFTGLTDSPNIARWWKDITARSSWQAVGNGA
ncbi:glutathione S-transferase-like protein [Rickenella mellea]|uniref:glutathione transferase n=1 Tax=Rickenella mellea TaxID=50990 RepID=A0A4Y7Q7Q5_9AGAM|nr:glutathione S-transferase-like protein [Rickenella mellea]